MKKTNLQFQATKIEIYDLIEKISSIQLSRHLIFSFNKLLNLSPDWIDLMLNCLNKMSVLRTTSLDE